MSNNSPSSTLGSGGKLASQFANDVLINDKAPASKRNDLRIAALEKNAQMAHSADAFPLIRAGVAPNSPNKTTTTSASDHTALPNDIQPGAAPLGRQGSATFSIGNIPRSSRSSSPTKRATAAVIESYQELIAEGPDDDDYPTEPEYSQGSDSHCGLDFLLQACDILEPNHKSTGRVSNLSGRRTSNEQITSRGRRSKRTSDEAEFDYTPGNSSDEEGNYKTKRANGRPNRRAATKAAAGGYAAAAAGGGQWQRGLVSGPCTNPHCEHPYESPQWRKGPPTNPVLCNACGTRWLRNGSLKPLVPRRGIRYGKARPKGSLKSTTAGQSRAMAAAARNARKEALEAELAVLQEHDDQHMYASEEEEEPIPAPVENTAIARKQQVVAEEPVAAPAPAPALFQQQQQPPVVDPQQLIAQAMAAGFAPHPAMFGGFPQNPADALAFQQQMAAVTAMAQAAQQAYAVAQAAMAAQITEDQQKAAKAPVNDSTTRPVFNITAVAAPQVAAPRFDTIQDPQP